MPDYNKGKIYKLWSPSKNLVYYGSTCETLSQRLASHRCKYKNYNNTNKGYITAFKVLECEDYKIELMEMYSCNNRQQLAKKEGEYIENNECVNELVAGRTKADRKEHDKEVEKKYREEHKEHYKELRKERRMQNLEEEKEYSKKYHEEHKEELNKRMRERYHKKKLENKKE
jgi:hypothetical protein